MSSSPTPTSRSSTRTTDDLLSGEHLDRLQAAAERGVEIYLAGISNEVEERIQETVPGAELFETLQEWEETPAGSLLITNEQTALMSALVDGMSTTEEVEETAIWGAGERNSLVVVRRVIFTWRLNNHQPS